MNFIQHFVYGIPTKKLAGNVTTRMNDIHNKIVRARAQPINENLTNQSLMNVTDDQMNQTELKD